MLKFDVSSDIATFYWLHHWSRQSESFSAWRSLPLSNRVAKQSDGSRLIAAVKVIHNLARAVPEKSHQPKCFALSAPTRILSYCPVLNGTTKATGPSVVFRWSGIPFQECHPLADIGRPLRPWMIGSGVRWPVFWVTIN